MNKVILIGRIARDLELKNIGSNDICNFSLAVNSRNKDDVNFFDCVAWGKTAETIVNYCNKGDRLAVDGSLRMHQYTNSDGQKITKYVININNITFIETKKDKQQSATDVYKSYVNQDNNINISDDDLPF